MRRREFITLLGGAVIARPLAARAQQVIAEKKLPIVGWLVTGSPTSYQHSLSAFRDGLAAAVNSLAHPGGNLTGFIAAAPETAAKRFQMIKELMPKAKRAAVLWNPTSSNAQLEWKVAKAFAETNDFIVTLYDARDFPELSTVLDQVKQSAPAACEPE
jgi:ABC-type uncharacterized transport system substrate-binding protein